MTRDEHGAFLYALGARLESDPLRDQGLIYLLPQNVLRDGDVEERGGEGGGNGDADAAADAGQMQTDEMQQHQQQRQQQQQQHDQDPVQDQNKDLKKKEDLYRYMCAIPYGFFTAERNSTFRIKWANKGGYAMQEWYFEIDGPGGERIVEVAIPVCHEDAHDEGGIRALKVRLHLLTSVFYGLASYPRIHRR